MVKDTLEKLGAEGLSLMLPKVSSNVQEKGNIGSKAGSVYRKRFKFSNVAISAQDEDEGPSGDIIPPVNEARKIIIRKAVLSLITHSPKWFADVSIFYFGQNVSVKK